MRHLLEAVARALRAHREMAVAAATAIVAAVLTGGGQGNLAAIVAAGAAGVMAGRSKPSAWPPRRNATDLRWVPGAAAWRRWSRRPESTSPISSVMPHHTSGTLSILDGRSSEPRSDPPRQKGF